MWAGSTFAPPFAGNGVGSARKWGHAGEGRAAGVSEQGLSAALPTRVICVCLRAILHYLSLLWNRLKRKNEKWSCNGKPWDLCEKSATSAVPLPCLRVFGPMTALFGFLKRVP